MRSAKLIRRKTPISIARIIARSRELLPADEFYGSMEEMARLHMAYRGRPRTMSFVDPLIEMGSSMHLAESVAGPEASRAE